MPARSSVLSRELCDLRPVGEITGLWACAKKLDGGRFRWPESEGAAKKIVLSHEQLALLLGGIDLSQTRARKWYRKAPAEELTESLKTA
jgi:transposase